MEELEKLYDIDGREDFRSTDVGRIAAKPPN